MGDDGIEKAMRTLAETVSKELGITINLKPVTMQGLHDDVVKDREYDLAYFWYDYPDTKFWLWPLLDSRAARINGSNFLNYPSGGRLETPCREALNHRNFDRVQSITHTIHQAFIQEMPFVPLWQLDRFIAHAGNVHLLDGNRPINLAGPEAPEIDPLRIFGTAETWRVGGK